MPACTSSKSWRIPSLAALLHNANGQGRYFKGIWGRQRSSPPFCPPCPGNVKLR